MKSQHRKKNNQFIISSSGGLNASSKKNKNKLLVCHQSLILKKKLYLNNFTVQKKYLKFETECTNLSTKISIQKRNLKRMKILSKKAIQEEQKRIEAAENDWGEDYFNESQTNQKEKPKKKVNPFKMKRNIQKVRDDIQDIDLEMTDIERDIGQFRKSNLVHKIKIQEKMIKNISEQIRDRNEQIVDQNPGEAATDNEDLKDKLSDLMESNKYLETRVKKARKNAISEKKKKSSRKKISSSKQKAYYKERENQ